MCNAKRRYRRRRRNRQARKRIGPEGGFCPQCGSNQLWEGYGLAGGGLGVYGGCDHCDWFWKQQDEVTP